MQASLSKMGIDPAAALERARSRSRSRVGRKRERSVAAAAEGMDVDGGDGALPPIKRVHSSKSRYALTHFTSLCFSTDICIDLGAGGQRAFLDQRLSK